MIDRVPSPSPPQTAKSIPIHVNFEEPQIHDPPATSMPKNLGHVRSDAASSSSLVDEPTDTVPPSRRRNALSEAHESDNFESNEEIHKRWLPPWAPGSETTSRPQNYVTRPGHERGISHASIAAQQYEQDRRRRRAMEREGRKKDEAGEARQRDEIAVKKADLVQHGEVDVESGRREEGVNQREEDLNRRQLDARAANDLTSSPTNYDNTGTSSRGRTAGSNLSSIGSTNLRPSTPRAGDLDGARSAERERTRVDDPPLPSSNPAVLNHDEFEPDDEWKSQLKGSIEAELKSMINDAKDSIDRQWQEGPSTPSERDRLAEEYRDTMKDIRKLAIVSFQTALERERQERRWSAGHQMDTEWSESLIEEQRRILDRIQQTYPMKA